MKFPPAATLLGGAIILGTLFAAAASAASEEGVKFFEEKIRPALAEHCYACHSADEKIKGGLRLDSRDGSLHGGDSGPAVVPGDLEGSLLWTSINWLDDYEMPPKKKIPAAVIADFKRWIEMGAPDPRVVEATVVETEIDIEEGKKYWSFVKPVKTAPPAVADRDWANSDIDRFVLARLEAEGLKPSADSRPDVLLRRLYFDLTGLPPSPDEILSYATAWKADPEAAYGTKVDELLASERFGERWGRHWLDVARYAESTGKDVNMTYPQAWRYRDYVVDAFNADKPYDQFLKEQLAGDLLPIKDDADWKENLIATGFLAIGFKNLNERDPRQFALDLADEQIDTTTQAMLGLTVSCARCHDHKSDPIPTADYYSLAGIFLSTKTHFGTVNATQNRRGTQLLELPVADAEPVGSLGAGQLEFLKERIADLEKDQEELRVQAFRDRQSATAGEARQRLQRIRSQLANLQARLNSVDENGVAKSVAMGVQDAERIVQPVVLVRGELDKPAQKVARGFPQVLRDGSMTLPGGTSGRRELAEWIASAENPLTARVFVNRVWGHLFGRGLVASPNNFGTTGQLPSHPELLDHLAVSFAEEGWSVKKLVRELVLSRSYQVGSTFDRKAFEKDPDNALLWRHEPKKVDAESLRDAMLAAAGRIDLERPRGSDIARAGDIRVGGRGGTAIQSDPTYRSVYLPAARDALPEALDLFDPADPNLVTAEREDTNVPGQALYLMNNKWVVAQAAAMAKRLRKEVEAPREQIVRAFAIAYARPATTAESSSALSFLRHFEDTGAAMDPLAAFCQSLLVSAEFRYLN